MSSLIKGILGKTRKKDHVKERQGKERDSGKRNKAKTKTSKSL